MDFDKFKDELEKTEAHYGVHSDEYQDMCILAVESAGGEVVFPKKNELQLDIDSGVALYELFEVKIPKFKKSTGKDALIVSNAPSASGLPHRHVVIDPGFGDLNECERIALQLWFGSDCNRELHGLLRLFEGCTQPTLFFEKVKWSDVVGRK